MNLLEMLWSAEGHISHASSHPWSALVLFLPMPGAAQSIISVQRLFLLDANCSASKTLTPTTMILLEVMH